MALKRDLVAPFCTIRLSVLCPYFFDKKPIDLPFCHQCDRNDPYHATIVNLTVWLSRNTLLTHWIIVTLYTASLFLFSDFTRYWLHRLLHKSELLWAFHQVHHSAEVLTPITFYRVHPVESVLFGFRYALSTGFVTGIFLYLFGAQLSLFDILGVNALHFIALFIGSNLRHSPVPLAYYHCLEHWFISPKQHQQHHTPAYSNKNFGGVLAIWDTLFNTLQTNSNLPSNIKVYGLKAEESLRLHSIKDLLFKPFISIIRQRKSF